MSLQKKNLRRQKERKSQSEEGSDESGTRGDGSKNDIDNEEVRPDLFETFQSHFRVPRFSIGADYFESKAYPG